MIKKIIGFLCSVIFCTAIAVGIPQTARAAEVAIDETNFPDEIFRNYVQNNCDKNNDGKLSEKEIMNVKEISVTFMNIASFKGIEHFTSLTYLSCAETKLTSLDVSKNTALTYLYCANNQLTNLNVSKNTALKTLYCNDNQLTSLDVSKNTALKTLWCFSNKLTSLDVSKNTALETLLCYSNKLTNLNVSKNTALKTLLCQSNKLTNLDVRKNTALTDLYCSSNQLTSLDVSKNTALKTLECSNHQITELDVSKNTVLKTLQCGGDQLTSLDVSKNTTLTNLYCSKNQLTNLDISKNTALTELACANNQLTSLNVSKNTALTELACANNQLTSLDVSKNTALKTLRCHSNKLIELKLNSQTYDKLSLYKSYLHGSVNVSDLRNITETATNDSDTVSKLKVIDITKPATYKVNGKDFTIIYVASTIDDSIIDILPDLNNLGDAEIKGPEISIGNITFNLFNVDGDFSLPIFDNVEIKINKTEHTAEILIGLGDDIDIETDSENDPYWKETYQEVKSLVKACGGKVDTPKLWNKFSKLRGKLKKLDGNAVFGVSGEATGYIKLKLDENNNPIRLIEGGVVANLEANAKVKTPLWWIIYSEFGVKGSADGNFCLTTENTKAIQLQGELGLVINPSIAIGADAVVVDIKGGIEGEIGGKVSFPWKSFEECVNAWLSGKLFIDVGTVIPGLEAMSST